MKKSVEILGLPVISVTEGSELGKSKSLLIDAHNKSIAALTIEDDDWYRGVKLIPYESVIAIGDDAVIINNSENILKLEDAGDYENLLDENIRIIGTKAITKNGMIQGSVTELYVGESGAIEQCEITMPDGSTFDVPVDQISIFGKQVTVISANMEKKTKSVSPEPPSESEIKPPTIPMEEIHAEVPEDVFIPEPTSEEVQESSTEEVQEIPAENPTEETPAEEIQEVATEIPEVQSEIQSEVQKVSEEISTEEVSESPTEEVQEIPEVQTEVSEEIPSEEVKSEVVEEIPESPAEEVQEVSEEVSTELPEIPLEETQTEISEVQSDAPVEEVQSEVVEEIPEVPAEEVQSETAAKVELPSEEIQESQPEVATELPEDMSVEVSAEEIEAMQNPPVEQDLDSMLGEGIAAVDDETVSPEIAAAQALLAEGNIGADDMPVDELPADSTIQQTSNEDINLDDILGGLTLDETQSQDAPAVPTETPEPDASAKSSRDNRNRFIVGKKAARTVRTDNGMIIVEAGGIITDEVLQRAKMSGKMIALSMSVQ